jgi:uncharacterized MAPEG superfamily protein
MQGTAQPTGDFRHQRKAGMLCIALALPVALALWLAVDRLLPPLAGMETLDARLLLALKCVCVAVLFTLVTGVEAVAHERLASPAFDPLAGYETRRMRVNKQYLQNTLEQIVVFAAGLAGLAASCSGGAGMRAVVATAIVWIVARFAFWIGYHQSAAMRGLGAPGMAMSMIVLLYVAGRFGYEIGGVAGAAAPVILFLAIEAVLFRTTSRAEPALQSPEIPQPD